MRAVIQRVSHASVTIGGIIEGNIEKGLLVFLGIEDSDTKEDLEWLSHKIITLRVFDDENKIPNVSLKETDANILLISQFTLYASTRKGNRPSYSRAGKAELAEPIYDQMIIHLQRELGKKIETGKFGADMKVSLLNDGPITILIDTKNKE